MRYRIFVFAILLLTGCTHYVVAKDGVSDTQKRADADQCFYDAKKSVAGASNPLVANSRTRSLTLQCMQQKGYTVTKS